MNVITCPETYDFFDEICNMTGAKERYQAKAKAEGIAEGRIKVYHEDLQLSPEEIADKTNIPLNKVVETIRTLQIAT